MQTALEAVRNPLGTAYTPQTYRVGIYARESRDDNGENYETIETQRDLLADYVRRNRLGEIAGIYLDDNVSGSAFERNGLEHLKKDVLSKQVDLVVLKDLSRLGRNNVKTLAFLDFLEEHGVRVMTFDGRYDSLRDSEMVGIETWVNERYVRDISRKIRANLRYKIEKGEYIGHAPIGYIKSTELKNKLNIDRDRAEIIREIFKQYRAGYGYASIAKMLNEKGFPPPSAGKESKGSNSPWNATAIQRILRNRVYIGDTVQGVSEKISFKSKKTRRLPAQQWVVSPNTHEAIISQAEFEEANRIRESKGANMGQHKGEIHLFKGLLRCGKCGSVLVARRRAGRPMGYICSRYARQGIKACTSHYVREDLLESIVRSEVDEMLKDMVLMGKVRQTFLQGLSLKTDPEEEIRQLEQILFSKQRQQDVLYSDRLEGKISDQLFMRTNLNIENRISQLRHEMEKCRSRADTGPGKEEIYASCISHFRQKGLTYGIAGLLVECVVVFDSGDDKEGERIKFHFKF